MLAKKTLFFIISVFIMYILAFAFSLLRIYNCYYDPDCIIFEQMKENSVITK